MEFDDLLSAVPSLAQPAGKKKRVAPPAASGKIVSCQGYKCGLNSHSRSIFFPDEPMEWGYYRPTLNEWAAKDSGDPKPFPLGDFCKVCNSNIERNWKRVGKAGVKQMFSNVEEPFCTRWVSSRDEVVTDMSEALGSGQPALKRRTSTRFIEVEKVRETKTADRGWWVTAAAYKKEFGDQKLQQEKRVKRLMEGKKQDCIWVPEKPAVAVWRAV